MTTLVNTAENNAKVKALKAVETRFLCNEPQGPAQDVQYFIDTFKSYLLENQIELIEHFKDKIFGFHLETHNQHGTSANSNRLNHEVIFVFEHAGVKGEITLSF